MSNLRLLISLLVVFNQIALYQSTKNTNETLFDIYKSLKGIIVSTLTDILTNTSNPLSDNCKTTIDSTYITTTNTYPIEYLISSSSKNKNDAMTFEACMKHNNTKYLLVKMKEKSALSEIHLEETSYVFGLCLSKDLNCLDNDYSKIIAHISRTIHGLIEVTDSTSIQVMELDDSKGNWFQWSYLFSFIPFLLIVIQFIFVLFKQIPYYFITGFMNRRTNMTYLSSSKSSSSQDSEKKSNRLSSFRFSKHFIEIENAYSLTENSEEIINYKSMTSKINNESGLVYIKGLRGIALILLVIGQVFMILWKSPANIYSQQIFEKTLRSFGFSLVFFGVRYSPGILFSCSGFILIFKFMCFLDDKAEDASNDRPQQSQFSNNSSFESLPSSVNSSLCDTSNLALVNSMQKKKVKYTAVLMFFLYQIHKYFILVLLIFFVKFNLYTFKNVFTSITPIWEYLYHFSIKSANSLSLFLDIFLQILCLNNFIFEDNPEKAEEILEVFWVANNEIVFFLLSTVVIFIFYKLKKSINLFVLSCGLLLIVIRIIIVFSLLHYQSTIYYTSDHYGKFFRNPIYNYPSYLIGLYFGLINYVIQKGMTVKNAREEKKLYLINVIINAKLMLKQTNNFTFIVSTVIFIVVIVFSLSQPIFLLFFNHYSDFIQNTVIKIFYLLDTEIVVLLLHYLFFILFIKGENAISNLIAASIWTIPHKMYYSIIVVMTTVIYFFFYQSETRIMLRMSTIIFYSLIIWCLIFVIGFLLFILFEVPYKRIIRFMTHKPKIDDDDDDSKESNDNPNSKEEDIPLDVHYDD